MTLQTIISSAKQDKLEKSKPAFQFYYLQDPAINVWCRRGEIAHSLKCARERAREFPDLYSVKKIGLHSYLVMSWDTPNHACYSAASVPLKDTQYIKFMSA